MTRRAVRLWQQNFLLNILALSKYRDNVPSVPLCVRQNI